VLGELRSGTLIPVFGAFFTNNTGITITSLTVRYTGEQWRLGTAGRTDQLAFQYSTDAISLTTGTWANVATLNFVTPNTITAGAKDGNATANRTALAASITGLSIANGTSFFIRWTDVDATGADDGLAIDDLTLETNVTLPILLISFSATKESNTSKISWTTAEEINTSTFKVQRSAGGAANWQTIATVQAMGQSSTLVNYQVYDANPGAGNNLYRLLSIDMDDKLYYSPIRRVNFNKKCTYSIYPNPAGDMLHITTDNINGINGVLIIENMHGQAVLSKRAAVATGVLPLNVSTLTSGLYLLTIINNDGEVNTIKLVRQ
jgi:hypothetical protein